MTQDSSRLASSVEGAVRDAGHCLTPHTGLAEFWKALSGSISSLFPYVLHQGQQVSPNPQTKRES